MTEGVVDEAESLAMVGRWRTPDGAYEHALVVLAMNLDCFIREREGGFSLEVDPEHEERVLRELDEYDSEQERFRSGGEPQVGAVGMELAVIWVMMLVVVYLCQLRDPGITGRFLNSSTALFSEGQWWRPFTALFLHADFAHLAGNALIGGVFCVLVAQSFGQLRGWLLILASGTLGNLLTSAFHHPEVFRSLGASTATFGALGLLVGMGVVLSLSRGNIRLMRPVIVPVAVGLILFGWFGVGGVDTDVLGHLFGLVSGIVLGAGATLLGRRFRHSEFLDARVSRR